MSMNEKQTYTPPNPNGGWDPSHAPADTTRMGVQSPQGYTQPMATQPMTTQPGFMPHDQQGQQGQPGVVFISGEICPVTGGAHQVKSRPGAIGLIIGIIFCPIGCIAVCFDQKETCRHCNRVVQEAWGGC